MKDRNRTEQLDDDNRIVIARSSAYPVTYAVTLVTRWRGHWYAVRTFDNSHTAHEHHEHRYIGTEKQRPTTASGPVNKAMFRAIDSITRNWRGYVEEWKETVCR
jgi:hypothetical protein